MEGPRPGDYTLPLLYCCKTNPQPLTCKQEPGGVKTVEMTMIEVGPHTHHLDSRSTECSRPLPLLPQLVSVCWPHHFHVLGKV